MNDKIYTEQLRKRYILTEESEAELTHLGKV